jgi:hypothetical protein
MKSPKELILTESGTVIEVSNLYLIKEHLEGSNMIDIIYTGESEFSICICVDIKDKDYGVYKFWFEFAKLTENNKFKLK